MYFVHLDSPIFTLCNRLVMCFRIALKFNTDAKHNYKSEFYTLSLVYILGVLCA